MPGFCLKSIVIAAACQVAIQAGAQVPLPLPAEIIDSTGPERGAAGDNKPAGDDSARRAAAEEGVEAAYGAAMKKCNDLQGTEKSACAARADAQRAKGKADIGLTLPATPKGQPSTGSTK
jgi:hypothetical protein